MSNQMTYLSDYKAVELIDALKADGHIVDSSGLEEMVLKEYAHEELPLYLRIIAGIGAFFSSIFIAWFLFSADILTDNRFNQFFWGCGFIGLALGLKYYLDLRKGDDKHSMMESFVIQSSFAAIAIGKALFVIGGVEIIKVALSLDRGAYWPVPLVLLVVTLITYFTYCMSIDRFLSSLAVLLAMLYVVTADIMLAMQAATLTGESKVEFNLLWFDMLFVFEITIAGYLITSSKIDKAFRPLGYTFVFAVFCNILFLLFRHFLVVEEIREDIIGNFALTGGLITAICWVGKDRLEKESLFVSIAGVVLLGLISAAGILYSVALLIIGYAKHDKILLSLGALMLPLFLVYYYYDLDVSLMMKSGVLVGSGVVLNCGYFYMRWRGEGADD